MLRGLALLLDNLLAGLLRLVNAKDSLGAPRARLEVDHLGLPRVDQGLIVLHGHVLQIGKVDERSARLPQRGRVPLHAGQHGLAHVREVARQAWARCIQQARRAKRAEGVPATIATECRKAAECIQTHGSPQQSDAPCNRAEAQLAAHLHSLPKVGEKGPCPAAHVIGNPVGVNHADLVHHVTFLFGSLPRLVGVTGVLCICFAIGFVPLVLLVKFLAFSSAPTLLPLLSLEVQKQRW